MKMPCYKCPDRHPLCHAGCEKYAELKDEREDVRKYLNKDRIANGYSTEMALKAKKRGGL